MRYFAPRDSARVIFLCSACTVGGSHQLILIRFPPCSAAAATAMHLAMRGAQHVYDSKAPLPKEERDALVWAAGLPGFRVVWPRAQDSPTRMTSCGPDHEYVALGLCSMLMRLFAWCVSCDVCAPCCACDVVRASLLMVHERVVGLVIR